MRKTGRAHVVPLLLLLSLLLASGSAAAFAAPNASAGLTGPIGETVAGPVREITETVTAPARGVTETVAPPAQEVTEMVTPPVREVTETLSPPVKEVTEPVTPPTPPAGQGSEAAKPAVNQVPDAVTSSAAPTKTATAAVHAAATPAGSSAGDTAKSSGTAVHKPPTKTAQDIVGALPHVTPPPSSVSGSRGRANDGAGAADDAAAPQDSGRPNPPTGPGEDTFAVPSNDGSVRAPLPKWLAYVWPAIALTKPALADLLDHLAEAGVSLQKQAGLAPGHGTGAKPGVDQGVAGVHAAGGHPESSHSSSSPFSLEASAVGDAFSSASSSSIVYFFLLALAVIGVAIVVRWEMVTGRHRRRAQ
jgi:hypothetical protein